MKEKTSIQDSIFNFFNVLFFLAFTFICVFPFYYLFINTISDNNLVQRGLITFLPKGIHFKNYLALKSINELGRAFGVTLSRTVLGTALMVAASAFIGFLMTKREMWGRRFWYRFLIIN